MRRRHPEEEEQLEGQPGNAFWPLPLPLPLSTSPFPFPKRKKYWPRKKDIWRWGSRTFFLALLCLILHESTYYILLTRLDLGFPPATTRVPSTTVSPDDASVAIVSLHRGPKFYGYLGSWWAHQKRRYASFQGYAYFDQVDFPTDESALFQLSQWQQVYHRRLKFDKLRYLLYLMEHQPTIQYWLWLDGDSIVTEATITVEERIHQTLPPPYDDEFCVLWAKDTSIPNTGILLLSNTDTTRQLLRTSLATVSESQRFMDQSSFTATIENNITYSSCQVLLTDENATKLQSRVRGPEAILWKRGDWILHLPNHNRFEVLKSLWGWLPKLGGDQPRYPCRNLPPLPPPDLSKISPTRRKRFEAVQNGIRHAWKGYHDYVIGETTPGSLPLDDLAPLSRQGISWLHYAATLHDSIDTLYLANLTEEYQSAVALATTYDIQTTSLRVTKTFEYSLRIVGGLLGAYSVSGDMKLLEAARNAADALLDGPFRSSPTSLPRPFSMLAPSSIGSWWDWKGSLYRLVAHLYEWGRNNFTKEHQTNSLAGVGSFALEFSYLSSITRDPGYRRASDATFNQVKSSERDGLLPTSWSIMNGEPFNTNFAYNLGSGGDSFYEYLLKKPILNGCASERETSVPTTCSSTDIEMHAMFRRMISKSLRQKHVKTATLSLLSPYQNETVSFPVDKTSEYDHLLCFVPGLLTLAASFEEDSSEYHQLAEDLLEGCYTTYNATSSGLGPDKIRLLDRQLQVLVSSYLLRPELVESIFVLYRRTKDRRLQDIGWRIFQNLERYCKVEGGGYAGLQDVNNVNGDQVDDMPSYFLAETLKYLLLLFGPDDYVSLNEFVFTTEAHPLRKVQNPSREGNDALPLCTLNTNPVLPVPWSVIAGVLMVLPIATLIILQIFPVGGVKDKRS